MFLDTIFVGDIKIPNQAIGVANQIDIPLLDDVEWDGIMGLAYPNKDLLEREIDPVFDNIMKQNILTKKGEKNEFAYYLGNDVGIVTFGTPDKALMKNPDDEIAWVPISERKYWSVELLDFKGVYTEEDGTEKIVENKK